MFVWVAYTHTHVYACINICYALSISLTKNWHYFTIIYTFLPPLYCERLRK